MGRSFTHHPICTEPIRFSRKPTGMVSAKRSSIILIFPFAILARYNSTRHITNRVRNPLRIVHPFFKQGIRKGISINQSHLLHRPSCFINGHHFGLYLSLVSLITAPNRFVHRFVQPSFLTYGQLRHFGFVIPIHRPSIFAPQNGQ